MEIVYDDIIEYYKDEIDIVLKNKSKYYRFFDIPKKTVAAAVYQSLCRS